MIYLSTTQSLPVVATLKEKASNLLIDNYTWVIVNRDSFISYTFSAQNWGASMSNYYDGFTVSVGTPQSLTGSNVRIDAPAGQYDYYAYQTTSQYDLGLTSSLGLCESGILQIEGTFSEFTQSVFTASNTDTIIVFDGL
jgi:hypothetical protein